MRENGVIFDEAEIGQMAGVLIEECVGAEVRCDRSLQITFGDMRKLLDKERGLASALASR